MQSVPLRGVQFHGIWFVDECVAGQRLELEREPTNGVDRNAIKVLHEGRHLGYLGREDAAMLAPRLDAGEHFEVELVAIWALYERTNGLVNLYHHN